MCSRTQRLSQSFRKCSTWSSWLCDLHFTFYNTPEQRVSCISQWLDSYRSSTKAPLDFLYCIIRSLLIICTRCFFTTSPVLCGVEVEEFWEQMHYFPFINTYCQNDYKDTSPISHHRFETMTWPYFWIIRAFRPHTGTNISIILTP